ncbi:MAG: 30S ribosomal protein S17 [Candidatus Helarchaeota archaeon]
MVRNIGVRVETPTKTCNDEKCPFHGKLSVRGRIFEGKVVSIKSKRTITLRRELLTFIPKYGRYEKRHSNIQAHCPDCLTPIEGKKAKIMECRPISKTKRFVVIECESPEK